MPPPTLAATMKPKMNGTTSRPTQKELKIGPAIEAPIACADRLGGDAAAGAGDERDEDDHQHAAGDEQADLAQHLGRVLADGAEAAQALVDEAEELAGGVDQRQVLGPLDGLLQAPALGRLGVADSAGRRWGRRAAHPPKFTSGKNAWKSGV